MRGAGAPAGGRGRAGAGGVFGKTAGNDWKGDILSSGPAASVRGDREGGRMPLPAQQRPGGGISAGPAVPGIPHGAAGPSQNRRGP